MDLNAARRYIPAVPKRPSLVKLAEPVLARTRPLTRWVRRPLRWWYRLRPALRHDVKPGFSLRALLVLHDALVGDLPPEFTVHGGRLRFRSERSEMALHGYYVGEVEYHVGRFILSRLAPGFTMVDVGAHHGVHSLVAAYEIRARGLRGRVHAFEPDPRNRALLEENVLRNGLGDLVTIHSEAVSDESGTAELLLAEEESSANTLRQNQAYAVSERWTMAARTVPTVRLDDLGPALGCVDLLKIDVQGSEPRVLAGAARLITRDRPVIVVEAVPGWPSTPEVERFLLANAYRVLGLDREGRVVARGDRSAFVSWDWVAFPEEAPP